MKISRFILLFIIILLFNILQAENINNMNSSKELNNAVTNKLSFALDLKYYKYSCNGFLGKRDYLNFMYDIGLNYHDKLTDRIRYNLMLKRYAISKQEYYTDPEVIFVCIEPVSDEVAHNILLEAYIDQHRLFDYYLAMEYKKIKTIFDDYNYDYEYDLDLYFDKLYQNLETFDVKAGVTLKEGEILPHQTPGLELHNGYSSSLILTSYLNFQDHETYREDRDFVLNLDLAYTKSQSEQLYFTPAIYANYDFSWNTLTEIFAVHVNWEGSKNFRFDSNLYYGLYFRDDSSQNKFKYDITLNCFTHFLFRYLNLYCGWSSTRMSDNYDYEYFYDHSDFTYNIGFKTLLGYK